MARARVECQDDKKVKIKSYFEERCAGEGDWEDGDKAGSAVGERRVGLCGICDVVVREGGVGNKAHEGGGAGGYGDEEGAVGYFVDDGKDGCGDESGEGDALNNEA